jgi:hypothetical protein
MMPDRAGAQRPARATIARVLVPALLLAVLSGCGGKWLATFSGIPPSDAHAKTHGRAAAEPDSTRQR